jgi:hypothetical protein
MILGKEGIKLFHVFELSALGYKSKIVRVGGQNRSGQQKQQNRAYMPPKHTLKSAAIHADSFKSGAF